MRNIIICLNAKYKYFYQISNENKKEIIEEMIKNERERKTDKGN